MILDAETRQSFIEERIALIIDGEGCDLFKAENWQKDAGLTIQNCLILSLYFLRR